MKRIVVFRFHDYFDICLNRLELIRKYNPEIKIYGIYGGDESREEELKIFDNYLENIYSIKNKSQKWKWKNFDLALRDWFRKIGNQLNFDICHIIEWDLVYFDSLDNIFSNIQKNQNAIPALIDLELVKHRWTWVSESPYKEEWKELKNYCKSKFNYKGPYYASLGPGLSLCYNFLERYSNIIIPELCHDELRIPLFSKIFEIECIDTKWYKWLDDKCKKTYNCMNIEIQSEKIQKELNKKNGIRVFHPVRKIIKVSNEYFTHQNT